MTTIVALSTPRGRGALSVVRLSGPRSLQIAKTLIGHQRELPPRTATLVSLRHPTTKEILDEAVVTFFQAPHSVTGEHVVEISCHGSPSVVRQILELALNEGALLAGPGEFTLRGLSNRKLNLAQAEAIRDLILSQTDAAAKQAARQLTGELSRTLEPLKNDLIEVVVLLESALEFVEDDLPKTQIHLIQAKLASVSSGIETLAESYRSGHLLRDGLQVAITGKPNVGKSSLFNRLVERDRAIVTAFPGTTRDTLSEAIDLGGIPVVLTDTAGLRDTSDDIESLGVARAQRALGDADLVLVVLDGSSDIGAEDLLVLSQSSKTNSLVILNKNDLASPVGVAQNQFPEGIRVSAKTGQGLCELKAAILQSFNSPSLESGGLVVTNARHHDLLRRITTEIESAQETIRDRRSEEVVLVPLHNALRLLGEITGETSTEAILAEIFSTFCIGK